jgi:SAM-dependent methyltransferase
MAYKRMTLNGRKMTPSTQRVDYNLIAHLYDEPGRDYDTDPNLIKFLEERADQPLSRTRILDMGCGTGKQLSANRIKYPELHIVGLDLFHGMLLQANKRCADVNWVQGDNTDPPFTDGSFDYITNQFSYHHVRTKSKMIAEVYRILKPGGRFAITNLDPWSMPGWIIYTCFPASKQRDFEDFLPLDTITLLMRKAGFTNIQFRRQLNHREERLDEFLEYASQRYRTSQLIAILDKDYEDGIAGLKARVASQGVHSCVASEICLIWVTGDKPK